MANTTSPVYGFIIPEVSADNNLWGTHLNQDLANGGAGFPTVDRLLARPQPPRAVVAGGVVDLSAGAVHEMTVSGAISQTFAFVPADPPGSGTNAHIASIVYLKVINGGVNVSWAGSITWLGQTGLPPILKASGTDWVVLFTNNNGTNWYGSLLSNGEVARTVAARVVRG